MRSRGVWSVGKLLHRGIKPERTQSWPRTAAARMRLLDNNRFTYLRGEGEFEICLTSAMFLERKKGLGIVLPNSIVPPSMKTALVIEVGKDNGIYQFKGKLLQIESFPDEVRLFRDKLIYVVSAPKTVNFYNERNAFRLERRVPLSAYRLTFNQRSRVWERERQAVNSVLVDLSTSGCGLLTPEPVLEGHRLHIELPLGEETMPVEAVCIRSESGWSNSTQIGMRFLGMTSQMEQRISQAILQKQREDRMPRTS